MQAVRRECILVIAIYYIYAVLLRLQQVTAPALYNKTSNINYISQTLDSVAALENVTEYDHI
jgi:hypothetical protein